MNHVSILRHAFVGIVFLAGCRGQTSRETPIVGIRNMYDQPRYNSQSESEFFPDHRTMRPPVDGAISREAQIDIRLGKGRLEDNTGYVLTLPDEAVRELSMRSPTTGDQLAQSPMARFVHRGQERFAIYCTPCHDAAGTGHGMVVKHGMFAPPSFHQDRLRHMPDGQIFATISNGLRNMPAYGIQIPVVDRWAIVAYVRALQLSQASQPVESNL